jgi:hypothetical protein
MDELTQTIDAYFAIWNEPDEDRRRELGRQVWSGDGRYVDPYADTTGAEQFAAFIGMAHERFPEHEVRRSSAIDLHHDQARFSWQLVAADGKVVAGGIDVCILDEDGKLQQVAGFVGELSPIEAAVAA